MNSATPFPPLVPTNLVWAAVAVTVVLAAMLVLARSRGAAVRIAALALFVLALANPSFTREDRDPLSSIAVVVVDKSPSQELGDRTQQTQAARAELAERLGHIPGLEVRFVEAGESDGETDGTRLFTALGAALAAFFVGCSLAPDFFAAPENGVARLSSDRPMKRHLSEGA